MQNCRFEGFAAISGNFRPVTLFLFAICDLFKKKCKSADERKFRAQRINRANALVCTVHFSARAVTYDDATDVLSTS